MKITKAMYMMSSVKLRKARQKLEDTEPYFYGLQDQIKSILYHFPTMQHLFFDNRNSDMHEQIKKKAFIVISEVKYCLPVSPIANILYSCDSSHNLLASFNTIESTKDLTDETKEAIIEAAKEFKNK